MSSTTEKTDANQDQAPTNIRSDDDAAGVASIAVDGVAKLLEMVAELKGEIGARLHRLESRLVDDNQGSVVSSRSSTFRAYAEARSGIGRRMTIASLEDEVMPTPARQHAAGAAAAENAGGQQAQVPAHRLGGNGGGYAPATPGRTAPRLTVRDLRVAIELFTGTELYKGLGAAFASWDRRFCFVGSPLSPADPHRRGAEQQDMA